MEDIAVGSVRLYVLPYDSLRQIGLKVGAPKLVHMRHGEVALI